jgi:uncharacterized protein (TIGR03000 family)
MRKMLAASVVAIGMMLATVGRADAWSWGHSGPWPQSAAFPCVNPPGWYTNTYSYAWQYPWFAYYNYSHGPYANWMAGGGYAYYKNCGNCGPYGCGLRGPLPPPPPSQPKADPSKPIPTEMKKEMRMEPGRVTISLPADARLLFNGTAATGTGETRTFATPALIPGQDYGYELTAEVIRDGRLLLVTERVVVRAGETARVTLNPSSVTTASVR